MKLSNKNLLAIILLALVGVLSAQTVVTSKSYKTDFEDNKEHQNWKLNSGPKGKDCVNKWYIAGAGANGGEYGLFVSGDGGTTNDYVNRPVSVVAYRSITLDAGYYEISFDWQAGGYSNMDGLYVCWVPESEVDTTKLASVTNAYLQTHFINNDYGLFFGSDSLGIGQKTWNVAFDTIYSDGTRHNLVFVWNNNTIGPCPPGAAIDNIYIKELGACNQPTNLVAAQHGDDILFQWKGDADSYEVRYILGEEKEEHLITDVKNKYVEIKDLVAGIATFYVRSKCGDEYSAWTSISKFIYSLGSGCINFLNLEKKNCSIATIGDAAYNPMVVDHGYLAMESRHTIHWNHGEYDPRTIVGKMENGLKTVPEGEFATVRLGNWDIWAETECIEYDYIVDSTKAAVLLLKYAVVLQDPDHEPANQPRFTLEILHNDKPLDKFGCGEAKFTAGNNTSGAGWHRVDDPKDPNVCIWWKDWTTVGLNLKAYHGKSLKIILKTFDCAQKGHYGYAYFTLSCNDGKIKGLTCGDDPKTVFEAPEGFNYRWYLPSNPSVPVSTKRKLEIEANDTLTYMLDVIQPTNANCYYTLSASGVGRWPQAAFEYKDTVIDCQNVVKFTNNSFIKRINQITSDTTLTSEDCEAFFWDFDDGTTSMDENPTHVFPAEGGTFTVTLKSSIAQDKCFDVATATFTLPKVGANQDTIYETRCFGTPYIWNGIPLYESGCYSDTVAGEYGCDVITTLKLNVLPPVEPIVIKDTICSDDEYYFNDELITKTGVYTYEGKSVFGCDSIVTLDIVVNESLHINFDSVVWACEDDVNVTVPYNITSGSFTSCDLELVADGSAYARLNDVTPEPNMLLFPMPKEVIPGVYNLNIKFAETSCGLDAISLPMHVYYSKSILVQRWGDVLAVTNKDYNGGYDFVAFQWYKNGAPIEGANSSILYDPDGLDINAEYSVLLTRRDDNVTIKTCVAELHDLNSSDTDVIVFKLDNTVEVDVPSAAKMKVWSATGILVKEIDLHEGNNTISIPELKGLYLFDFWFDDSQRYIKQVVLN